MRNRRIQLVDSPLIRRGLVGYWPFLESTGATFQDVIEARNGTLYNSPARYADNTGFPVSFNGTNQYGRIQSSPALSPGTGNFSIIIRIKTVVTNSVSRYIFKVYGVNDDNYIAMACTPGSTLNCYVRDSTSVAATTAIAWASISTGNIVCLGLTRTGTTCAAYLDGVKVDEKTNAGLSNVDVSSGTDGYRFAAWAGTTGANSAGHTAMSMCEFRYYSVALTDDEHAIIAAGRG